jgi:Fe-S-cluster containining protein
MVESLDLYRLARFFGMEMSEVITQYTDTAFLAWGFPVFMLKTKPHRDTCVFLKPSGCSVYEARPRTCRLYPLGVGPDDDNPGTWLSFIVSKKQHHFTGRKHRAGDWIDANLTPEDRSFVAADYGHTGELAKLMKNLGRRHEDRIIELILLFKYAAYDMTGDFQTQYTRNMERLKRQLKQLGGG